MLDHKKIKSLAAPERGSRIIYDHESGDDPDKTVRGFGLRITAAGAKSFVLNYRTAGQERRLTIGSFPTWSVAQARDEVRRLRRLIDQGEDPLGERIAGREAPTVRGLAERYIEEHLPRKRQGSARDDQGMIRQWILPALGNKKVAAVRPSDIEQLHAKITKAGKSTRANRVVALLSTMLSLAVRWEYIKRNPARDAVQRNPETKRRRYLSSVEISRLSTALIECISQDAADAIRLLMLTGARRNEICGAKRSEFDLAAATWSKPAGRIKQKADHYVPLGAAALEILARRQATADSEYVFPGRGGAGHLNIRSTWETVRKAAGLEDVRLHDLRHTFASILVSGGASLPLIGALLGHSDPRTTSRYSHLFLDPQRAAAEKVGAFIIGGEPADVVPLGRARR